MAVMMPGNTCGAFGCRKRRYATREAAEEVIRRKRDVRDGRSESRAYFAHDWWHVTSEPTYKGRKNAE